MHVLPFGMLLIGTVLLAWTREWRLLLQRLKPLAPVVVIAGVWSAVSKAGGSFWQILKNAALRLISTPQPEASFTPWDQALRQIPDWLLDIVHPPGEDILAIALLAMGGFCFLFADIWRGLLDAGTAAQANAHDPDETTDTQWPRTSLAILVMLAWALYFLLPQGYDWVWPIGPRFALIAVLFTIPLIPPPTRPAIRLALIAGLSLAIVYQSNLIGRSFQQFQQEEVVDFAQAVEAIPMGARVAGLIFERGSRAVRFAPFIHSVAHVQAKKGGAVLFTFADFPQSPFRFRPDNRPPRVQPRWEWTPDKVDPRNDLAWFDYVLVRGGPGAIARQPDAYSRVYTGPKWSVWKRDLQ